jgi:hypothetical protein
MQGVTISVRLLLLCLQFQYVNFKQRSIYGLQPGEHVLENTLHQG